ncbi:DedA family protein [Micromonospora sp. NBC_01813]|uniref:DedA family protein n=1 Tax=Micromonospora sp. NBC_01813 TaxID=2975988 RepID=UPI002DDC4F8C|nr:DedA family protein [Micromonospora sp. NBC_01813]WSA12156.1 DedA family protein [Micromonospora sp. NBC_01813]
MTVTVDTPPEQAGGLTGWVAGVIESLGEVGVGLLVALESVVPPIPSEVVLAMAGYLASQDRVNLVGVWTGATVGSLAGALLLYWLGAAVGEQRLRRWLDRVPLVDPEDLDSADRWFDRYGRWAVLFGRMVPIVRSLVSVPAGADRMPLAQFSAFTTLGSGVWNALFVGAGFALGSQWQQVERYSRWFDIAVFVILGGLVVYWVVGQVRRRRRRRSQLPAD